MVKVGARARDPAIVQNSEFRPGEAIEHTSHHRFAHRTGLPRRGRLSFVEQSKEQTTDPGEAGADPLLAGGPATVVRTAG